MLDNAPQEKTSRLPKHVVHDAYASTKISLSRQIALSYASLVFPHPPTPSHFSQPPRNHAGRLSVATHYQGAHVPNNVNVSLPFHHPGVVVTNSSTTSTLC